MPKLVRQIDLEIQGLGVILYSPFAVLHIQPGADYFEEKFQKPEDVAWHVRECKLTGFCTGSPGSFRLDFFLGEPDETESRQRLSSCDWVWKCEADWFASATCTT